MEGVGDDEGHKAPDIGENILTARDVYKRYVSADRGVIKAVNGVSFDVSEKEIFGIIGKSGAGKTTLSRIISGIIEPTSGEMNIRIGDDVVDMTNQVSSSVGEQRDISACSTRNMTSTLTGLFLTTSPMQSAWNFQRNCHAKGNPHPKNGGIR